MPVLPNATQWVQNHITALVQAQTQTDIESVVDAFLAKDASIVINGAPLSRADFVAQLASENFAEAGATVSFLGSVAVPTTAGDNYTGAVGVFYKAVIGETFVVRDAPITSEVTASLNVVVEQDKSIPQPAPPAPGIRGFFDGRRVTSLNEVRIQAQAQVTKADA